MNKRVTVIIVVVVAVALCIAGMIFAPNLTEIISRIHTIPRH
jgi:hypothetical protein